MYDAVDLTRHHREQLLGIARESINHGLAAGQPLPIDTARFDDVLQQQASSFVTLTREQQLRGCIGSLVATQALVEDVAQHAHASAFRDPRFPPLQQSELSAIHIEISVLTPEQLIDCYDEQSLLAQLIPFEDGLTLRDRHYQATFLPSVWKQLPDKTAFVQHLKAKAGMPLDYWSDTLKAYRYRSLSFAENSVE